MLVLYRYFTLLVCLLVYLACFFIFTEQHINILSATSGSPPSLPSLLSRESLPPPLLLFKNLLMNMARTISLSWCLPSPSLPPHIRGQSSPTGDPPPSIVW